MCKKWIGTVVFIICLVFGSMPAFAAPEVSAVGTAVINADTGELLVGKNETKRMSMASTTKIMTSVIALEQGTPDRVIKITKPMVLVEGTSLGLREGDEITLRDLVFGMLLESGNDAANTVALSVAGSKEQFAELMNQKAQEIGMTGSHFVTPSGLDDENHYSTPLDMAKLGAYAIQNPEFREICSQTSATVTFGNPPFKRTIYNHNKMLKLYEGAFGIKTGFTKKSGRCLVTAARRGKVTLVCVTLKDPNDWDDTKKLLDYGFSVSREVKLDTDFSACAVPVIGGGESRARVVCASNPVLFSASLGAEKITRKVYLPKFVYAAVSQGDTAGYVEYYANGKPIARAELLYQDSVSSVVTEREETKKDSWWKILWNKIKGWF